MAASTGGPARADTPENAWSAIAPILDKHCSRCHQDGKTKAKFKDKPAGKFGFVLDEAELIKRNKLIPGNADGSEIFVKVAKGDMPKDIDDACFDGSASVDTYCGMSKEEKAALHDEINRLSAPQAPAQVVADAVPKVEAKLAPEQPVVESKPVVETKPVYESKPDVKVVVETKSAPSVQPELTAQPVSSKPYDAPPPPVAIPFINDRQMIRVISEDVANAPPGDGQYYRYLTLTHLLNAGETDKDLRVYRLALAKLVNSLSTISDVYTPVAIDSAKTIYRLDIRRLGWTYDTWNMIAAADPYVILYADSQFKSLQHDLKTVTPFVRGDWFTFAASRPPLYYQVLDLPHTKAELQAKLGVNPTRDFDDRRVERAGFQQSGVSDNNRLIERHAMSTGAYWESYDFGSNEDRKSLFQFPLGPSGAFGTMSERFGFKQDGGEIIFNLPNGFQAYYLTDGKGNRLDIGPTKIVRDPSQRDLAVTNGISCMGCHDKGMIFNDKRPGKPLDQVRELVLRSGSYPSEVKDIVSSVYPSADMFNKRMESDAKHFAEALGNAGINVNTHLDGIEIINALSKRFEENLNARLAASEVGMTEEAFMERLNAAGGPAYDLKLRLQQDLVPRDQFVSLYARLVNTINDYGDKAVDLTKVAQQTGTTPVAIAKESYKSPQTSKTFDLAFYTKSTSYRVDDVINFTLRSEQPCFLTLTDTDAQGRSTVLFPNGFHPDSRIEANVSLQIPGPVIGGFKLVAPEPGVEHITATCNASFPSLAQQDFSNQTFATFGSSRDLIGATTDAQVNFATRLLVVKPDGAGHGAQLVSNPIDPKVPITATKGVVLTIRAH